MCAVLALGEGGISLWAILVSRDKNIIERGKIKFIHTHTHIYITYMCVYGYICIHIHTYMYILENIVVPLEFQAY